MPITGVIKNTVDLNQGITCIHLGRLFAESDGNAHTFEVTVLGSGKAVDLTGANITGYFTRGDDSTVFISNGEVNKNIATVILPEACYASNGKFSFVIRAVLENYRTTIYWADGEVIDTITDTLVDPGKTIPNLDELLARIKEMEEGIENANSAANRANTSAEEADAARDRANTSAEEADAARDRANTSAEEADAARDRANDAAKNVEEATNRANASADKADEAANNANFAADRIDESIENANSAANRANTSAEEADAARDKANESSEKASQAAENANNAALIASKWENVDVTVSMEDSDFSPVCVVTDRDTGGVLMAFRLPRGLTGLTPNLQIGKVNTGEPGSSAEVSIRGTPENPIIDMTIPKGKTGNVENLSIKLVGDVEGFASAVSGDIVIETKLTLEPPEVDIISDDEIDALVSG